MADGVAFIDGEYMPAQEVKIPLFDLGFTRGDAVYDTVSVWQGRFFRLDDHVARFLRSCAGARLTCPHPPEELKRILAECVHRTGLDDAYVQMIVTRGEFASTTNRDPRQCRNRFAISGASGQPSSRSTPGISPARKSGRSHSTMPATHGGTPRAR